MSARRNGFTLVEILVVMAIIALLLSISLPRYFGSVERSKEVALRENLQVMRSAIDHYAADTGNYPSTPEDLVSAGYLRAIPVDPVSGSAETWRFETGGDPQRPGIVDVHSGAAGNARDETAYAQW